MWQVIQLIVFYLLFLSIVILLFLIWRENLTRSRAANHALIEVAMKSVDASNKSSETALKAAEAAAKGSEAALKASDAVRILVVRLEHP